MSLLARLKKDYPDFTFTKGDIFVWSPKDTAITYKADSLATKSGQWSLLHELSHGLLGHTAYQSDIELLKMEAAAWHKAKKIASTYNINISEEYIQNCLDTYRDWVHLRSKCPVCGNHSTQRDARTYNCFNCNNTWYVSSSRFCRPYRRKATVS